MCYFVTLGLPENKTEFLEKHVPRGLHIRRVELRSVQQQMGHGICTYLLMSGDCSCAMFNEYRNEAEEGRQTNEHVRHERRRRKYEKLGWSLSKIQRALGQRTTPSEAGSIYGLRGDVQRFLGELAANVGKLAVLVHWYDGDVQNSRFACKEGEVFSHEVALGERLEVSTDEIFWINRNLS